MFPAFINGLSCQVKTPDRRRGFLDFGITQKSSQVICSEILLPKTKCNKVYNPALNSLLLIISCAIV